MPVRKIPKNFRFLTGVSSGSKGIGKSSFESALERDLLILLEFDPDVLEYEVQPIRIPIIDLKGKPRFFTPDVRIVYRPEATSPWRGKTLIVEVKCLQDLRDGKNNILGKLRAGVSWCRKNGAIFKVFTESHIRTPLLQNARFLLPCRRIVPDDEDILRLLDALHRSDGSSPKVIGGWEKGGSHQNIFLISPLGPLHMAWTPSSGRHSLQNLMDGMRDLPPTR